MSIIETIAKREVAYNLHGEDWLRLTIEERDALLSEVRALQQRIADCEMSLSTYDEGRSSEYWERYATPEQET